MLMKTRFVTTLSLLAVLLAACAPAASPTPIAQPIVVEPSVTPLMEPVVPTLAAATLDLIVENPTALPVATSRGPALEATDPTMVSLASGGLHFVEFFRFT